MGPSDGTSVVLYTFIHSHLSLFQKLKLSGMPLAATVDLQTCRILSLLSF
ncbi:hypothetical protein [Sodalis-like endosymbiont of Proechinophthirus fluctus]|nr:hypothetical protein [Sodalis-like endosymbiont of Proechinophthirus fluctus]